jgi:hypothetical protein
LDLKKKPRCIGLHTKFACFGFFFLSFLYGMNDLSLIFFLKKKQTACHLFSPSLRSPMVAKKLWVDFLGWKYIFSWHKKLIYQVIKKIQKIFKNTKSNRIKVFFLDLDMFLRQHQIFKTIIFKLLLSWIKLVDIKIDLFSLQKQY